MAKRMLIDAAHPEETRVVVLAGHRLEEFDFETSTKKQIKGNIYLAKVIRVEPSLQAAFVEYGGNRHGFLAFNEIHPDYYRIPVSDRRALQERGFDSRSGDEPHDLADHHGEDDAPAEHDLDESVAHEDARSGDEISMEMREADDAAGDGLGRDGIGEETDYAAMPVQTGRDDVLYDAGERHEERADSHTVDNTGEGQPRDEEPENPVAPRQGDDRRVEYEDHHHQHGIELGHEPAEGVAVGEPDPLASRGNVQEIGEGGGIGVGAGEENARPPADTIETIGGGDEIEEAARPRARPHRHYKIQEVIKRRQIMLVQVTKEERGNKGAALTTYLSLAGRYCVLMPNTPRGGGVSRKITNATDRRRLKDLMSDLDVPDGMGVIVRTAGSERSKPEIKRDFEYLLRLWDDIRDLTLKSTAPALIYEEGNLIKRSIRDLYTRDLEEVIVDGEEGYRTAKAFMKMLMPSHAKRIKLYHDPTVPLFHRYQVESQIDAIHSPVVQLRSGGYIVINPTEALVAIDVNSGRSTKERNIEETALKTNLEAAEEIARQLRLRDLAGLIVIDFIDMEEHRNQAAVERKLKEAMRFDRARIQLGRISPFGLLELSRQRLRPSLLEASTQPCPHCNGTGHIRSIESTALHVLRAVEEEGMRRRSAEIAVSVPTAVALYILNNKRDTVVQTEARYGFHVTLSNDDALIPPAFRLERLRALSAAEIAALPPPAAPTMEPEAEEDEEEEGESEAGAAAEEGERRAEAMLDGPAPPERPAGDEGQGRRRRRRRRRGWRGEDGHELPGPAAPDAEAAMGIEATHGGLAEAAAPDEGDGEPGPGIAPHGAEAARSYHPEEGGEQGGGRKRRRRGRRGGRRRRRSEPSHEALASSSESPISPELGHAPIAETVEYVAPSSNEEGALEIVEALHETPAPTTLEVGAESVPISEEGDHPAPAPQPVPAPERAPAPQTIAHEVTSSPPNPKRGWWRRVIDN